MDSEEQAHIREMLRTYQRRLRELEKQEARYGPYAPPHVRMEIEDLRKDIARCEAQIEASVKTAQTVSGRNQFENADISNAAHKRIEITLSGSFEHLTPEVQSALVHAIAGIARISPDEVSILNVRAGSVIFTMELPGEAADTLMSLYAARDETLKELRIQNIRLVPEQELPLPKVVQYAIAEQERFQATLNSDTSFSYELFRRAFVEQDELASRAVENLYKDRVERWIQRAPFAHGFEILERRDMENLVHQIFDRFRRLMSPERFRQIRDLGTILRFLKMATHSVLVDHARALEQTSSPGPSTAEETTMEEEDLPSIWSHINRALRSDQERQVIYASFVLDLEPTQIYQENRNLLGSIAEVNTVRQRVLERLSPQDRNFLAGTSSKS